MNTERFDELAQRARSDRPASVDVSGSVLARVSQLPVGIGTRAWPLRVGDGLNARGVDVSLSIAAVLSVLAAIAPVILALPSLNALRDPLVAWVVLLETAVP